MNCLSLYCRRRSPKIDCFGITLVEVVAALVLAATTLSAVLVAYGRVVRQRAVALERLEAVKAADLLLAEWFSPDVSVPMPQSVDESVDGRMEGHESWFWRLSIAQRSARRRPTMKSPFAITTYRLEVLKEGNSERPEQILLKIEFCGSIEPIARVLPGAAR